MKKVFLIILSILIPLFVIYCDLAVTEEEILEDVSLTDISSIEDVYTKDVQISDISISDTILSDEVIKDIVEVECESERDCSSERPYCMNGACVQCRSSEDCKSGEVCNEHNECEYQQKVCMKNSDCDLGYICKDNKCVEGCLTNKDCPPSDKPNSRICNTQLSNPVCVECLTDKDCTSANLGTKCDSSNVCITVTCDPPCNAWEHCTNEGKCELNEGACNSDKDCQKIDPNNICDMTTHTCKVKPQCVTDKDCDALCPDCGGYCRNQKCECITNCPKKGICEQCNDTSECQQGLECKGVIGKYCQPPSCQNQNDCGGKMCFLGTCACGI